MILDFNSVRMVKFNVLVRKPDKHKHLLTCLDIFVRQNQVKRARHCCPFILDSGFSRMKNLVSSLLKAIYYWGECHSEIEWVFLTLDVHIFSCPVLQRPICRRL
jgi:hypothetical protein